MSLGEFDVHIGFFYKVERIFVCQEQHDIVAAEETTEGADISESHPYIILCIFYTI